PLSTEPIGDVEPAPDPVIDELPVDPEPPVEPEPPIDDPIVESDFDISVYDSAADEPCGGGDVDISE
ncbi:MAG: hypothetical protein IKD28_04330, partial [Clostridia bacterium]|nr:hypothetical protein [Clostridia bacterium]